MPRVTEIPPLFRPSHHVELLAFSPDGKAIALSEAIRGRVEIVNIESRKLSAILKTHLRMATRGLLMSPFQRTAGSSHAASSQEA